MEVRKSKSNAFINNLKKITGIRVVAGGLTCLALLLGLVALTRAGLLRTEIVAHSQESRSNDPRRVRRTTVLRAQKNNIGEAKSAYAAGRGLAFGDTPVTELELNTAAMPIIDIGANPPGAARGARTYYNNLDWVRTNVADPITEVQKLGRQTNLRAVFDDAVNYGLPVNERSVVLEGEVTNAQAFFSEDGKNVFTQYTITPNVVHHWANGAGKIGSSVRVTRPGARVRYSSGKIVKYGLPPFGSLEVGQRYVVFLTYPLNTEVPPMVGARKGARTFFFLDNAYLIGANNELMAVDRRLSSTGKAESAESIARQPLARLHLLPIAQFPARLQQSLDILSNGN